MDSDWDDLVSANERLREMRRQFKRQSAAGRRAAERGRKTQRKGKTGELIAERVLRAMGFKFLKPVGKHVHLSPVDAGRGLYRVKFVSRLAGDFTAVGANGISVLAEVKHIDDRDTLRWSDLRPGQAASLTEHYEAGGLSLLIWVHRNGVCVLEWPVPGFGPGRDSLSLEAAKDMDLQLN